MLPILHPDTPEPTTTWADDASPHRWRGWNITAQMPGGLDYGWIAHLERLLCPPGTELKHEHLRRSHGELGQDLLEIVANGVRLASIFVVSAEPHRSRLESRFKGYLDSAHPESPLGRWLRNHINTWAHEETLEATVGRPLARLAPELADVVDTANQRLKYQQILKLASQGNAAFAKVLEPGAFWEFVRERCQRTRFVDPNTIGAEYLATQLNVHSIFDAGDDVVLRRVQDLREGARGAVNRNTWLVAPDQRELVTSQPSSSARELQAADLAAGVARTTLERGRDLRRLRDHFAVVLFNGQPVV